MIVRVLTALLLAPTALLVIFKAPPIVFVLVVGLLATFCFREYGRIVAAHGIVPPSLRVYAGGWLIMLFPRREVELVAIMAAVMMATALRRENLNQSLPSAAAGLLGLLYIFGSWSCGAALHAISPHWLVLAVTVNWVGDTVALYVGKAIGRHKMAPRISPGKTWEGAIGSILVSSVLGMFYLGHFFALPWWQGLLYTGIANFCGQMGDLAESGIKRGANVKDSGSMLPGHGGWLDRLDSSLFSMPAVYLLVTRPWEAVITQLHW